MELGSPTQARGDATVLDWKLDDIEQKLGFSGGQFTTANKLLSFLASLALTAALYGIVWPLNRLSSKGQDSKNLLKFLTGLFMAHGVMPALVCLLFFWAMATLFVKWRKLVYQRKALDLAAVPRAADFTLDRRTAAEVLKRINKLVDSPSHFILLNRIERALSNLRNIGNITEVSHILRTQAEYDEEQVASSYKTVAGFVWAIPVLGFIGTVLGLSRAIGGFSDTVQVVSDMNKLTEALKPTLAGLSTAFEVTFVALAATLIVQLCMTQLQHAEAQFLDECNNYCHANVVTKLRLTDEP